MTTTYNFALLLMKSVVGTTVALKFEALIGPVTDAAAVMAAWLPRAVNPNVSAANEERINFVGFMDNSFLGG
ncbi:hypothetical protein MASR1M59_14550 [Melaminivora sp.]